MTDCGVSPTCPITGMPRWTRKAIVSAISTPPSSFTAEQPVRAMTRAAESNAAAGERWYEPNGISTATSACALPRTTAPPWLIIMSSVTGSVLSKP